MSGQSEAISRVETLPVEEFDSAALFAAGRLSSSDVAVVYLAPGDMTEYRFVIAKPPVFWAYGEERPAKYYYVTLCQSFGAGYEWAGHAISADYATEKWTNPGSPKGTRAHTGAVVARFLTAVADHLKAGGS